MERGHRADDEVYTPEDPADRLHFLLSGVVRTYRIYGNSKQATTALLKDAGVLDLSEEGGSHEEFAEAVTEGRVASVRKAALAWLVKRKKVTKAVTSRKPCQPVVDRAKNYLPQSRGRP